MVTVGLEQNVYLVDEEVGTALFCAILSGQIERDVLASFTAESGSAQGEIQAIW